MSKSNRDKQIVMVLEAIKKHHCNTSQDVSDVTGLNIATASAMVSELIKANILIKTKRTIPSCGRPGRKLEVFQLQKNDDGE